MSSIHIEFAENERVAAEAFMRLATTTDESEGYERPHALRIAKLADEMAKAFRLARADRSALRFAALLHDVGEAAMKREYIKRPGPLSEEERLDLARHPVIGEQEAARVGASRAVQLLVRWHQEWWDGAGYPDALRQQQIPLAARILRVADAYAALTDARPFRPAGTVDEARKHLTQWAGLEFDPHVVRVFLALEGFAELRSYARAEQQASAEPRPTVEQRPTDEVSATTTNHAPAMNETDTAHASADDDAPAPATTGTSDTTDSSVSNATEQTKTREPTYEQAPRNL
ncbi:MAG TPA: HD domain-containing phosphohydrolase [Pyrinomonadaceae bacterium]|jgi:HD-GYP domain-containing protein (c-di-GMP phosphodiesterase class II)